MDILATILGPYIDSRRYSNQYSLSLLSKAVKVMTFAAKKSPSNVQLIETELSKAYLLSALSCKDSESDSIYCLASVYLSVLYYTTGQYQTAIDQCTLVTRSRDRKHCSLHVVQGEVLPKIDCDIDNILGLSFLYDFVRSDALDSKQSGQNASVFTTELFAYYLRVRILSIKQCRQVTQTSLADVAQQYAKCTSEMPRLFIGDVLIFKLLNRALEQQTVCNKPQRNEWDRSAVSEFETNSLELTNLLQESAVEHLKAYRQLQAQYFGSVVTMVTTNSSEALYAYKRVDYQHCLQLCSENILKTLYAKDTTRFPIFPEFIPLLDDDIVSLTGLTLIVNPKCRDHSHSSGCSIIQLILSLYLMTQCQLKLQHSAASLAHTLDCLKFTRKRLQFHRTLDQLTLKLAECKIMAYLKTTKNIT